MQYKAIFEMEKGQFLRGLKWSLSKRLGTYFRLKISKKQNFENDTKLLR